MKICIRNITYLTIILIACQCNESPNGTVSSLDSANLKPKENAKEDSESLSNDTSEVDISTDDILNDYIQGYQKKTVFDSMYVVNSDTFQVVFRHYCLLDSGITVPLKYVSLYGLNQFVTHNFESRLIIKKNSKEIVDRKFIKKQFDDYLDEPLKKYGVLLYPEITVESNHLEINYSVSIPLTDIGTRIEMIVGNEGEIEIKKY